MTDRPIKDLVASVHQRLLNKAHQARRPFEETWKPGGPWGRLKK